MSSWRTGGLAAAVLGTLGILFALTGAPAPAPAGKTVLNFWQPWPGDFGVEMRHLVQLFNDSHPDIEVRTCYVPNSPSSDQKLFLAISAGIPPDCTIVGGQQVCEWAARGALLPIDEAMAEHGVRAEDFWEPCARQCRFEGKTYALTFCADPNFALFWNRAIFREEGLLEQGPPRTLEELDAMARRLTKRDERGRLTRVGFIPWDVFGYPNSMFTWGWAFGGESYDEQTHRITCADDPHVVEALHWMKSYADEYGFEAVSSFAEGFGNETDHPFIRGKIAMAAGHISNLQFFKKYAPNLDYAAAPFPYPERLGSDHSAWMGGWAAGIPHGSRHPKEAFEFLKWLCSAPEVGKAMVQTTGQFPGFKESSAKDLVKGDDKMEAFYGILQNTHHQRPVMPAQAYYMGAFQRTVSDVLNNLKTPEEALRQAQQDTQKELDRVRAMRTAR